LHDGKQHGLADTINKITNDVQLVIIPDAGTNDIDEMQQLIDSGKKILCMDHHESDN
jgi:single-stranded-DNA-specific exonuclease